MFCRGRTEVVGATSFCSSQPARQQLVRSNTPIMYFIIPSFGLRDGQMGYIAMATPTMVPMMMASMIRAMATML